MPSVASKGNDVFLPLGVKAPVYGIAQLSTYGYTQTAVSEAHMSGGKTITVGTGSPDGWLSYENANSATNPFIIDQDASNPGFPDIYANLQAATSAKINQIREAFQLQKLFERDARGGTRYTEIIKAHFGVTSPDARLQRPEYLGGGSTPINIHPVAQTSASGTYADSPQETLRLMGLLTWVATGSQNHLPNTA